jgi:hypothetical protein
MTISERSSPADRSLAREQSRFIIRSTAGALDAAGRSDRPINGENGLNSVTRYTMKMLFEGGPVIITGTYGVPLMPRSRIDRRKTKPTVQERNGNFNCAKGRACIGRASPPFLFLFSIPPRVLFLFPPPVFRIIFRCWRWHPFYFRAISSNSIRMSDD